MNRSAGKGTRKPGKEKRIDDDESFILVNAADNVSVCSMDAIKDTYCIPRKQILGQLAALFSKSVHFVIYCVTRNVLRRRQRSSMNTGTAMWST